MVATALLIIGHGSRDARANQEFESLVAELAARRPGQRVAFGYVELAEPSVDDALTRLASEAAHVVVVPLFLFSAGHVKNDLPLALDRARRAFPQVRFSSARALGVHPVLAELIADRARSVASLEAEEARRTAVIVVGRGSSDPDANGDFCKLVRLFADGRGLLRVEPAFIGITRPSFEESLEHVARVRPDRIVVVPYYLNAGRLLTRLEDQLRTFAEHYPWIPTLLAPHLGRDPRLLELVEARAAEALAGTAELPCDTCQYRAPMPGREEHVGGLRAMLWSLRHSFTHAQAAPHLHAHKPVKKHVLVCGNADCADRGSIGVLESVRRLLKDSGRQGEVKVTRTSCMGRCGEGPTVVVYPDGIWYRGVTAADTQELVHDHLLGDRLVGRLVDNIMQ